MGIILASKSPRRKELLSLMGLEFKVITADIDETMNSKNPVTDEVKKVSLSKALAVKKLAGTDDVIISADTVVVNENGVLGKPQSEEEAFLMLKSLSGKTHRVITAVTVIKNETQICDFEETFVTFRDITDGEIRDYIKSGEPMDKAGAYGIQGKASVFVSGICGDFYNVVGLPVCKLHQILSKF